MSLDIPEFKDDQETAEFWDGTDSAEFMQDGEVVEITREPPKKGRCGHCGAQVSLRYVEISLFDGVMTLHRMKEYYCPSCHRVRLSREARREIERLEANLREKNIREWVLEEAAFV